MDRNSTFTKIYIIYRKYGRKVVYIPLISIGIIYSLYFIFSSGSFGGIAGVVLGLFWGLVLAPLIAPIIANMFGDFLYYSPKHLKTAPDIMSPIKGKIARQEYEQAIEELSDILEKSLLAQNHILFWWNYTQMI